MENKRWEDYYERLKALKEQAEAALQAGDTAAARHLAQELLIQNIDMTHWNYGNEVHDANQILGLVALQEDDTVAAAGYLLAAGRTPGSPQLASFGPTMTLAQALLSRGQSDVVLEYLDMVAQFWAVPKATGILLIDLLFRSIAFRNHQQIRHWKAVIQAGEIPTLNRVAKVT